MTLRIGVRGLALLPTGHPGLNLGHHLLLHVGLRLREHHGLAHGAQPEELGAERLWGGEGRGVEWTGGLLSKQHSHRNSMIKRTRTQVCFGHPLGHRGRPHGQVGVFVEQDGHRVGLGGRRGDRVLLSENTHISTVAMYNNKFEFDR